MAQFLGGRCVGVGSGITPDSKRQHTGMNLGSYQRYMRKFADLRAHGAPMGASRRELAQELLDTFRTFKAAADDCDDYVELPDYDATVQELEAIVSQESPGTHATAILRSCTHILVRFANQDQAASPVQNRPRRKSGCGWTQFQFRWEAMLAMVALEQAKGAGCGGGAQPSEGVARWVPLYYYAAPNIGNCNVCCHSQPLPLPTPNSQCLCLLMTMVIVIGGDECPTHLNVY